MDRFLTRKTFFGFLLKGGAAFALPFFIFMASGAALRADASESVPSEDPNLDAGARVLLTKPSMLNGLESSQGFPTTGGTWLMWGGGATITPGSVRAQFSAWEGALNADAGSKSSQWNLSLATLTLEQRYPLSTFLVTAGSEFDAALLNGSLIGDQIDLNVLAPLFGYGVDVGVRWPAQTKLGFFLRAGYLWLSGDGAWRGNGPAGAPALGGTHFELGGPNAIAQLELSF